MDVKQLTKKQIELFPQLLQGYIQRQQQRGIEQLIKAMSSASKKAIWDLCESEFRDVLGAQLKQLEEVKKNGS